MPHLPVIHSSTSTCTPHPQKLKVQIKTGSITHSLLQHNVFHKILAKVADVGHNLGDVREHEQGLTTLA